MFLFERKTNLLPWFYNREMIADCDTQETLSIIIPPFVHLYQPHNRFVFIYLKRKIHLCFQTDTAVINRNKETKKKAKRKLQRTSASKLNWGERGKKKEFCITEMNRFMINSFVYLTTKKRCILCFLFLFSFHSDNQSFF